MHCTKKKIWLLAVRDVVMVNCTLYVCSRYVAVPPSKYVGVLDVHVSDIAGELVYEIVVRSAKWMRLNGA